MLKFFSANKRKITLFAVIVFGIYLLYFHNLWSYKLLDVDETRYVDMARTMFQNREFNTLYLNGDYFFEKPPLFFWIESLSFYIFNCISEFTARIPIALQALFAALAVYFAGLKVVSKKFAVVSALIFATSLEVIMLSKIAILDMLLSSCIIISTFFGFLTFFAEEKNKKYCWIIFYLFSALATLAKGIPGVVIPFGTMFFAGIYTKKFKEFFRPQYFLVGACLFLLVVLPWHILMLKTHGQLFFDEYIIKHHLLRFIGSEVIHRSRPIWYYFGVIGWGFLPWIFPFLVLLVKKAKTFKYKKYADLDAKGKFLALNIIGAVFTIAFFSTSSTKLITYILPIYSFLAVILASLFNLENIKTQKRIGICVFAMILVSAFVTPLVMNIDYKYGQNDLMEYAQTSAVENKNIVTYNTGRRYSLLYYSGNKKIDFLGKKEVNKLNDYLNDEDYTVIIRNKDLKLIKKLPYQIEKQGVKYSVIASPENAAN